jgi:hypothetical protein
MCGGKEKRYNEGKHSVFSVGLEIFEKENAEGCLYPPE